MVTIEFTVVVPPRDVARSAPSMGRPLQAKQLCGKLDAAPSTSREGMHSAKREKALFKLLVSLFSAEELSRWVRFELGHEVYAALPNRSRLSEIAFEVVVAISDRGLASERMFETLVEQRQNRTKEIHEVERLWLIGQCPPRPENWAFRPSRSTRSRALRERTSIRRRRCQPGSEPG